jgi:hypothetical protein
MKDLLKLATFHDGATYESDLTNDSQRHQREPVSTTQPPKVITKRPIFRAIRKRNK